MYILVNVCYHIDCSQAMSSMMLFSQQSVYSSTITKHIPSNSLAHHNLNASIKSLSTTDMHLLGQYCYGFSLIKFCG